IKWTLALLSMLFLTTCQKALDDQDLVYIGSWSSKKHYIEIAANGYGFYQRRNRSGEECRVKVKDKKIVFNWEGGRKSFCIDTPPSVELSTGMVFMVLDGRDFYKH
ncbi:MAG: hypothetical protein KDC75_26565, partial [Phaeodactylibacter sp.]|nr:hypothetical protein [Phaeodactylibacter sp.]